MGCESEYPTFGPHRLTTRTMMTRTILLTLEMEVPKSQYLLRLHLRNHVQNGRQISQ